MPPLRLDAGSNRGRATTIICSFGGSWPDAHPSHLASAGCATLATGVLPRWTGWVAYTAALANLAAAPSILGGTDYTLFWPLAM
jgi:hypothetical protein